MCHANSREACVTILDVHEGGMPRKSLSIVAAVWRNMSPSRPGVSPMGTRTCLDCIVVNCVCQCCCVSMSMVPAEARGSILSPGAGGKRPSWATQGVRIMLMTTWAVSPGPRCIPIARLFLEVGNRNGFYYFSTEQPCIAPTVLRKEHFMLREQILRCSF